MVERRGSRWTKIESSVVARNGGGGERDDQTRFAPIEDGVVWEVVNTFEIQLEQCIRCGLLGAPMSVKRIGGTRGPDGARTPPQGCSGKQDRRIKALIRFPRRDTLFRSPPVPILTDLHGGVI